jgi:membrane peptidoglycan carboxypeptidase
MLPYPRPRRLWRVSWIRPRDHTIFTNLGSLLVCGVLAGVVVAAVLFPGIALSGLAMRQSFNEFDQLPTELTIQEGPQISYIYANDGETRLATMYSEFRRNVPLHDIPQVMIDAIIAAEDQQFYEHNGVDVRGIARAFIANTAADEVNQGASTITQQLVRLSLTYFSEDLQDVVDATEDTPGRKLQEARYALALEQQMTKDEILNRYLNLAFFGEGAYGIYAASQVYLHKRPVDLELHEAAFLAGLVRSPSEYSPAVEGGPQAATDRRNWVLDQMVETGAITPAEAAEAKAVELDITPRRQPNMCVGVEENNWGFFCDYFYRWWLGQEAFGATPYEREQSLRGGGFRIVTTLDPDVQEVAKNQVERTLETGDSRALMVAVVEPGTGAVRGMATNRRFALDDPDDPQNGPHTDPAKRNRGIRGSYPNTTNPIISGGGDIDGYQGGSTFKLFTLLAALESGLPLSTTINSPSKVTTSFIATPEPGNSAVCGNRWCPSNFPGQRPGNYNMWTGFGSSINTYFAQLLDRIGSEKAVDVAKRLGIRFRAPNDQELADIGVGWGPFTIGVSATTPLDLANAYATVSAGGVYCEPTPVEEIRTFYDEELSIAEPDCERVLDRDIALAAIDAGRCVTGAGSELRGCPPGGGTAPSARSEIGKPVWGKSGTSDGERTAVLVLSTRQYTVAGILADPDWAQTTQRMDHDFVNPAVIRTLRNIMRGVPGEDWPTPEDRDLFRRPRANVPDVRCATVEEAQDRLRDAGFQVELDDNPVNSDCPAGRVAGTNPSGRASQGDTIRIQISNGSGDNGNDDGNDNGGPGGPGPPGD